MEVEELRSLGVTAILSLQAGQDMEEGLGIESEKKAALAAKLTFRSVPVEDPAKYIPPNFDDLTDKLPKCLKILQRLLNDGHTICTAGRE